MIRNSTVVEVKEFHPEEYKNREIQLQDTQNDVIQE